MSEETIRFPVTIEVSDECLGTAQCVMTAPELFELDDTEHSWPRRTIRDEADLQRARTAARSCPTQAIALLPNE